jgi:hypothetical protein
MEQIGLLARVNERRGVKTTHATIGAQRTIAARLALVTAREGKSAQRRRCALPSDTTRIRIVDEVISIKLRDMFANFHFTHPPPSH